MKVSEIDPLAILFTLEILMDEVDPDSGSKVGRPPVLVGGEWQPINDVSIETEHGSDFTQAEVHGGTLRVESSGPEGTTFIARFELRPRG